MPGLIPACMHGHQYTLNPCGQAKALQLLFTVITGELFVRIDCTDMLLVDVRKSWLCRDARRLSVRTEASMVSGLAGSSKTMEGGLLLSEGLRQTVTHQPKDCLLLTARVTRYNKYQGNKLLFFMTLCEPSKVEKNRRLLLSQKKKSSWMLLSLLT